MSIKHPEADRIERERAARTGEGNTEAVISALRERLERTKRRTRAGLCERLPDIGRECAQLPEPDARTADEILAYGADGLPQYIGHRYLGPIAILLSELDARAFAVAIEADPTRLFWALSYLEASIVIETRRGVEGVARLDILVAEAERTIAPFTCHDARSARRAYRSFGRGQLAAGLGFGDCAAYALANETGEPLLFKASDFSQTDVLRVL